MGGAYDQFVAVGNPVCLVHFPAGQAPERGEQDFLELISIASLMQGRTFLSRTTSLWVFARQPAQLSGT